jgi:hypothetical protein
MFKHNIRALENLGGVNLRIFVNTHTPLHPHPQIKSMWTQNQYVLKYQFQNVLDKYSILLLLLLLLLSSLVTGLFFLVLLLNQPWSPPLSLQASRCSIFRIMYYVLLLLLSARLSSHFGHYNFIFFIERCCSNLAAGTKPSLRKYLPNDH